MIILIILLAVAAAAPAAAQRRPGPPAEHDLAVVAIDEPAGPHAQPGVPLAPAITVRNAGSHPECGFRLFFAIGDSAGLTVHLDSLLAADTLRPDSLAQYAFPSPFTPQPDMAYLATAWVALAGDEWPYDDTLTSAFSTFLFHDLGVASIDTPASFVVAPGLPLTPAAAVRNGGTYVESGFLVHFRIGPAAGPPVYLDSAVVPALAPLAQAQVVFSPFVPESLSCYLAVAFTALAGDTCPGNDSLSLEFRTFEYAGSVSGTVMDENAGAPLAGAVVTAASGAACYVDTADAAGCYGFGWLPSGTYALRAGADGYVDSAVAGFGVTPGSVSTIDFALGYPDPGLTPADTISVTLAPGTADSSRWLVVQNDGTRPAAIELTWPARGAKAAGDSVWGLDVEALAGDNLCLGAEFDGTHLWVTGAAGSPSADPNRLYKISRQGALLASVPQPPGNGWGWRDLCWDGQFLYGASGSAIEQIDTATGAVTGAVIPTPCAVARGLAHDPVSDRFLVTDFADSIYQIDRAGGRVAAWSNNATVYGLAWDAGAPDGPWLWCLCDSAGGEPPVTIRQFDPRAGGYTGLRIAVNASDPANASAGGLAFSSSFIHGRGTLISLVQDARDRLVAYDVRPDNARWLSLSRSALALAPSQRDSVRLTFDNAGLDSSLAYRAWIRVATGVAGRGDSVLAVLRSPYGVGGDITAPSVVGFALLPCRPNPLRMRTAVSFSLPYAQDAELSVYNIAGQLVRTLLAGRTAAGRHTVEWNGTDSRGRAVGSGVYLCRLRAGVGQRTIRMALVR